MALDPPPRVDHAAFLGDLGRGLSACDALDVGLILREHAADADLGIPRAVYVLRVDLDPVAEVVSLDEQAAMRSSRSLVSPDSTFLPPLIGLIEQIAARSKIPPHLRYEQHETGNKDRNEHDRPKHAAPDTPIGIRCLGLPDQVGERLRRPQAPEPPISDAAHGSHRTRSDTPRAATASRRLIVRPLRRWR